jgi:hypothetical protein
MDDHLLARRTSEEYTQGTHLILKHLWEAGDKISKKKSPNLPA